MKKFIFISYDFDRDLALASFKYSYDNRMFTETVSFKVDDVEYDSNILDSALFLAFVLIGTSYYKSFPTRLVELNIPIDEWQSDFFNRVYQEGLSQFAFENNLKREDLANFKASKQILNSNKSNYQGRGIMVLQSGGKDSLLTASLLNNLGIDFTTWYLSNGGFYPKLLKDVSSRFILSLRTIDKDGLKKAADDGAINGHIPITYIVQSLAVIQSILLGKSHILTSIAHEGEELHHQIGDLPVTHQWSKTWAAEKAFSNYVTRYISPNLYIGSSLRRYSELRVAELFVKYAWQKYSKSFSSCNVANYRQGSDNSELKWCGDCPKCANSYLLFAPFLTAGELRDIFKGQDLFSKSSLEKTFKGLLGIDGFSKPFECIGEIEELRTAYHMAQKKGDYQRLPFDVPASFFDYTKTYPAQYWAIKMLE